ncbi:transglycosylase SLT domain-containing protein [Roseomonas sp. CAU 1739]|uniref:transglycosylase SLT domain-containing protein n=1 Tax=Roseomonas sp. CAU 1739 TaxID=3140364 RepID=UPI00325C11C4
MARGARHLGSRLRRLRGFAQRRRRLLSPLWAAALAGALALTACAPADAGQEVALAAPAVLRDDLSPRAACLDAAREAEREHGLPEGLLVGIALNESGLHAHALNIGGRAYYPETREEALRLVRAAGGRAMVGCMQVNAAVHARGGQEWPLDPYKATEWAANYLRQHYETYGDWSMALVRWHGGSAGMTTRLVCRVRSKIDVVAPDSSLFSERCEGTRAQMAAFRRNGQALLELAEAP